MKAMDAGHPAPARLDVALGVIIRLLVIAVCALGGGWAASAVPILGGMVAMGAAVGFAVGAALVLREKALASFWARYRDALSLAALFLYVAALAAATWSELFHLAWFDWLPF